MRPEQGHQLFLQGKWQGLDRHLPRVQGRVAQELAAKNILIFKGL
jgi:hypothetical protein